MEKKLWFFPVVAKSTYVSLTENEITSIWKERIYNTNNNDDDDKRNERKQKIGEG